MSILDNALLRLFVMSIAVCLSTLSKGFVCVNILDASKSVSKIALSARRTCASNLDDSGVLVSQPIDI